MQTIINYDTSQRIGARMSYKLIVAVYAFGSLLSPANVTGEDAMLPDRKPEQIDACALLAPAEISQIVGLPVETGVRRDAGYETNGSYSSTCVWAVKRGTAAPEDRTAPLGGRSFVILNAMRWPDGSGLARSFLEAFHEAARNGELPGKPSARDFGDEALWWGDGLAVRKRDVGFGISVFMPGAASNHPGEFEAQLAPKILRRLDQHAEQPDGG